MKNVYLCLAFWLVVWPYSGYSQVITTVVGNGSGGHAGDGGPAIAAELLYPTGVHIDRSGNMLIGCYGILRKVNTAGIISTIAGDGTNGYSGDGGPAIYAEISNGVYVTTDDTGNVYIADFDNDVIRKVDTFGIITTIAGIGFPGYGGDGGPATLALLNIPYDIAIDKKGRIYVVDFHNNRIRRISTSGIISTVAGTGTCGFSGDGGPATDAELCQPFGIVIDSIGTVYFTDGICRIRRIDTSGTISTIAGNGVVSFSGDGGPATNASFDEPGGLAFDSTGNLYVVDDQRIRMINTSGIVNTIAGNGSVGYSGDGGNPLSAEFNSPQRIALDRKGNIYISDSHNHRIRMIRYNVGAGVLTGPVEDISIGPDPSDGHFFITLPGNGKAERFGVSIANMGGQTVYTGYGTTGNALHIALDVPGGIYVVNVTIGNRAQTRKITIIK